MTTSVVEGTNYGWEGQFEEELPAEIVRWYLYKPMSSSKGIRFESEYDAACYSLNEFINDVRRAKRKEHTIKEYSSAIGRMIDILHMNNHRCDPLKIDEEGIYCLMDEMDVIDSTKRHYLYVLKIWICGEHGNNVFKRMKLLWNDDESTHAIELDHEDFMKVWRYATDPTDRIILTLGGRCGLRRHEIHSLRIKDIHENEIVVRGKGHGEGKVRKFPITAGVREEIDRYIKERNKIIHECSKRTTADYLLVIRHYDHARHISYSNIGERIRRLSEETGVEMTTHSLRRHHATYVSKDATLDMMVSICKSMGWSSFDMFLTYISSNKNKLKNMMEEGENEYISATS